MLPRTLKGGGDAQVARVQAFCSLPRAGQIRRCSDVGTIDVPCSALRSERWWVTRCEAHTRVGLGTQNRAPEREHRTTTSGPGRTMQNGIDVLARLHVVRGLQALAVTVAGDRASVEIAPSATRRFTVAVASARVASAPWSVREEWIRVRSDGSGAYLLVPRNGDPMFETRSPPTKGDQPRGSRSCGPGDRRRGL
jgi:hypothetical protein